MKEKTKGEQAVDRREDARRAYLGGLESIQGDLTEQAAKALSEARNIENARAISEYLYRDTVTRLHRLFDLVIDELFPG